MRTTLNIDDTVLQELKQYADTRSLPLGTAASHLLRKGLESSTPTKLINGFVVFDLPPKGAKISTEFVKKLESELE